MAPRHISHLVGVAVAVTGLAMSAAVVVSLIYGEWSDIVPLLASAAAAIGVGWSLRSFGDRKAELTVRESFAAVALAWFAVTLIGSLPYLSTGSLASITDGVFESVSGFTATGASVVADPASLGHGILFWRALTQWLGGMGVVMLVVAVYPIMGMGSLRLGRAEAPGPMPERVTPRFRETARLLWVVFLGFTVAQTLLLWLGDMTLFEAITHSFTTLSGGGFSTKAGSLGAFSPYAQWVVIVFMLIGGTSFALHYRGLRRPMLYLRDAEFKLYMAIVALAALAITVGTWGPRIHETVRGALFTASSILTTTGFVTSDFGQWVQPLQIVLIGLMFVGAMSGSTSGSVKVYRIEVIYRSLNTYSRRLIHGRSVNVVGLGGAVVQPAVIESVRSFLMLYLLAFFGGVLSLALIASAASSDLSLPAIVSAVASSLGNVGPGLEGVGPTATYQLVPVLGKWVLSGLMIIGRLEIIPVMVLLNREAWRS